MEPGSGLAQGSGALFGGGVGSKPTLPASTWIGRHGLEGSNATILRIAEHCGALNLRVFGSVVRGNDRAHSDVDLLVDMDRDRSLLNIVGVGRDLEELLDRGVDVLTRRQSHPALHDRILAESRRACLLRSHPRRNNDIENTHR
jgi:uncharacterized protein